MSCPVENLRIQAPQRYGRFQLVLVLHSRSKTRRDESGSQTGVFYRALVSLILTHPPAAPRRSADGGRRRLHPRETGRRGGRFIGAGDGLELTVVEGENRSRPFRGHVGSPAWGVIFRRAVEWGASVRPRRPLTGRAVFHSFFSATYSSRFHAQIS